MLLKTAKSSEVGSDTRDVYLKYTNLYKEQPYI